jgi:hypothetical protein
MSSIATGVSPARLLMAEARRRPEGDIGCCGVVVGHGRCGITIVVGLHFALVGHGRGFAFKPTKASAASIGSMSVSLDLVSVVWAIAEIPGGIVPILGVPDLVVWSVGRSGRLEVFYERGHLALVGIGR